MPAVMPGESLHSSGAAGQLTSARGLRVALFSGNYNYARDGANKALNKLVGHLLEQGADVRVYSPTGPKAVFAPNGDLVSVPSVPIPGRPEYRLALGLPAAIKRDFRAFQPNIVHLSAPDWLGTGALRLARSHGLPVVASFHTRFETYFEYYGLGWLRNWAWKRQQKFYLAADLVLAPNESVKTHLEQMGIGPENIRIWGRGVDTELFSPRRRDERWRVEKGYSRFDTVVLFFGRIVREKGVDCFMETLCELRRRGRHLRPLIVGQGPAKSEMERVVPGAYFTGDLDGEELARAIASADILLNPSVTEAFGNVNLEAMASGLAIVSADAASARSLIVDGFNGVLRPPNPVAMADAVATLIDEPATRRRLGKAAAMAAGKRQWLEVLEDVTKNYWELRSRITSHPPCRSREGRMSHDGYETVATS